VTVGEYCAFLNEMALSGGYGSMIPGLITQSGNPGSYHYEPVSTWVNRPILYVSYYDAVAYAAWLSSKKGCTYRLPTEEEWEKAAGWDPSIQKMWLYGFQEDIIDCSWANYYPGSGSVGAKGCYEDWVAPVGTYNGTNGVNNAISYYGCYDMSGNAYEWTTGSPAGTAPVLRGGAWHYNKSYCTTTYRYTNLLPSSGYSTVGFRLVLELPSPPSK
jgi:formylglycine-generating enzyme required for sulfatase activity